MDLSTTTVPDSTQVNAEDLITGPQTVTITAVRAGTSEQPANIDLAEFPGRAYRPSKSMRRVLVFAWGPDTAAYIGRRITIYRDPDITFGRDKVGGIRISHLSHLDKRLEIALTVTRGRRAKFTVDPLSDESTPPSSDPNPPESRQPDQPATSAQNRKMHALFRDAQISDRDDRLAVSSAILGFPLTTSSSLTVSEASKLIDTLDQWQNTGETDEKVRDILNTAALAAESTTAATEQE